MTRTESIGVFRGLAAGPKQADKSTPSVRAVTRWRIRRKGKVSTATAVRVNGAELAAAGFGDARFVRVRVEGERIIIEPYNPDTSE